MKIIDYFLMAFKNFKKKKMRMGINIISISIGVMFIVTLISISTSIQGYLNEKMNEVYTVKQVSVLPINYKTDEVLNETIDKAKTLSEISQKDIMEQKDISDSVISDLVKNEKVEDAVIKYEDKVQEVLINQVKINDASLVNYKGSKYLKIEEQSIEKSEGYKPNYIAYGNDIDEKSEKSILITEDIATLTFKDKPLNEIIGSEISITTYPNEKDVNKTLVLKGKVVGLISSKFYQPSIVVSKDIMSEMKGFYLDTKKDLYELSPDKVSFSLKNVDDVESFVSLVENDYGYTTESVQNVAKTINSILSYLNIFLFSIGLIVIIIAGLDIVNTMSMSVYERTKSIGLMKAIGATNRDVLRIFLVEGSFIGLIGTIVGIILSNINILLIKEFIITSNLLVNFSESELGLLKGSISMDIGVVKITFLLTIFISILASLYPSLKAARLNPIDALRYD